MNITEMEKSVRVGLMGVLKFEHAEFEMSNRSSSSHRVAVKHTSPMQETGVG